MRTTRAATLAVVALAMVAMTAISASAQSPGTPSASPPTPAASPAALPEGPLTAGTYSVTPFAPGPDGFFLCAQPPQPGCSETTADDSIRATFTVPDGWAGIGGTIFLADKHNGPPDGAGMHFDRGGWLFSDPCIDAPTPDVPVGPTVDDFVGALVAHPLLDVTAPVDVELAGYSGKYLELQGPPDITACPAFFAWNSGIYAQGPDHRWHIWVLDVGGVRVVVRADTYPGTSLEDWAELQAIVDSIHIDMHG